MNPWSETMTSDFILFCTPKPGWPKDQQIAISTNRCFKPRIVLCASDADHKNGLSMALTPSEARIIASQLAAAIAIAEELTDGMNAVDLASWGRRELYTGEAPSRRV